MRLICCQVAVHALSVDSLPFSLSLLLFLCLLLLDGEELDLDVLLVDVLMTFPLVKATRDGRDAIERIVGMSVIVIVVVLGSLFLLVLFLHLHKLLDNPRYVCENIGIDLAVVVRGHLVSMD